MEEINHNKNSIFEILTIKFFTMDKQYFIVEYSQNGRHARRITGFYSYSVIKQKANRFSSPAYIEIENTDEDFYGLRNVELNEWINLPKPRF